MRHIAVLRKLFDRSRGGLVRPTRRSRIVYRASGVLSVPVALAVTFSSLGWSGGTASAHDDEVQFAESRIFIEYNSTDNDLGFHVFLDGEDWTTLEIVSPRGRRIFNVEGRGGYKELGLTELFFEGAEPSLFDVPLDELLAFFPEGTYEFEGRTVDGGEIGGEATLTHAVPAGPDVSTSDDQVGPGNALTIRWDPVTEVATDPAGGVFPDRPIDVVAYQVIVGSFEVTLPAIDPPTPMSVTVPPEFVASLEPGSHEFEVLAIEEGGNQTITSDSFTR
jgi:hypothetical protein